MKILCSNQAVFAAEGEDTQVSDMISELKEDFEFVLSSLERLERQGANGKNDALMIGENVNMSLQQHIDEIANKLGGNE